MFIGHISGATRMLGKPSTMTDAECSRLAVRDVVTPTGHAAMLSAWYPTPAELKMMEGGAPIYLWIFSEDHPVVAMTVCENPL